MTIETNVMEPFGPLYPNLPSVAKFRRIANGRELTPEESKAYAEAGYAAIRELQRRELHGVRSELTHKPPTFAQILAGTYPLCPVPASHKPDRKFAHKGGMHNPQNWDTAQRSRYEAAMEETRRDREAQAKKAEAEKVEAPIVSTVVQFVPAPQPAVSLTNSDGSYNRGNIMREAHALARSSRVEGRSYAAALSDALRTMWSKAKANAARPVLKAAA